MNRILFVALLALVCAAGAYADDVDESDVIVGSADNFDELVKENDFALVEFYAPWCGHCKKLTPEYAEAATKLKGKVALVKVDATVETDLAAKYEVKGYPTLKFFRNGEASDYGGGRTAAEIVQWCEKKSGPPSTQIEADGVGEFTDGKLAVVGSFAARSGDDYDAFVAAAASGSLDDFAFGDVEGAASTSIKLYAPHLDEPLEFDGSVSKAALEKWVLANGYPLVDEVPQAWERYSKKGHPLAILFVDKSGDYEDALAEVTKAAAEVADSFSFCFADGVRFKQQIERMGGDTENLPSLAAMKLNGKANYPYTGELTAAALTAWAKGIVDGSVEAVKKSEEIPASNDGPVTVVVGKQFEELVLDETKDVMLEIYAPWCGHCKSLAPIYEELGEKYADDENVVIAKLDGTANDIDVEFRGFPTLKFFPAKAGGIATMQDYEGGRTLDDMAQFIDANRASKAGEGGAHEDL